MNLYVPMSSRREKRRAWDKKGSTGHTPERALGMSCFQRGYAGFGQTDLYGCSHSEANTTSWNQRSRHITTVAASSSQIAAVLAWLDSAKISTLFPPRTQVLADLFHVAELFALFHGN